MVRPEWLPPIQTLYSPAVYYNQRPPTIQSALPRTYAFIVDEAGGGDMKPCTEGVRAGTYMLDITTETKPFPVSVWQVPVGNFCEKGGRFGPHNQHQPQGQPCLQPIGDLVYLTYFNAGLQIFDISDPYAPRIAGYYIPDDPTSRRGPLPTELVTQSEDVLVDRRGFAYVTDKNAGVTIVRFEG